MFFYFREKKMNKEQIEKLIDDANLSSTASFRIREGFEQNPIEPVVVGLTDEQAYELVLKMCGSNETVKALKTDVLVREYLKTQTFAQPIEFSNVELMDSYQGLMGDFEALSKELEQLKEQQFQPNWDDAPDEAVIARIWVEYVNKHNVSLVHREILAQYERPKPLVPKVEVGQVWKDSTWGLYVEITNVDNDCDCIRALCFENANLDIATSTLLAKFELVQS